VFRGIFAPAALDEDGGVGERKKAAWKDRRSLLGMDERPLGLGAASLPREIVDFVGMACEAVVLDSLDKNTAYDFLDGETPTQRLADLKQQKASIKELLQSQNTLLMNANQDQMANYWERTKIYGELDAMRWWQQQNPVQAQ